MFESNRKRYHLIKLIGLILIAVALPLALWSQADEVGRIGVLIFETMLVIGIIFDLLGFKKSKPDEKVALYGLTNEKMASMKDYMFKNPRKYALLLIFFFLGSFCCKFFSFYE